MITFTYQLPMNITAGTVTPLASARPFYAVTGIDHNGDGANNDRPLRVEGFNLFNHGNLLGRAQRTDGDTGTVNTTFGQVVAAGTATNAIPALANIDPPRTVQFQVRYVF